MEIKLKEILLKYIGCEAEIVSVNGTTIGRISSATINHNDTWSIRPILRPLSDLKQHEEDEWSKVSTTIGEMAIESAQQIHFSKRLDFYRSIGIDCDNLIETGKAINKLTLFKK